MIEHTPQPLKVEKPWGAFERFTHNQESTVKILTVNPGGVLSNQYHFRRDELWMILDAGARVDLGTVAIYPEPGETIFIPNQTPHRLSAVGDGPVRVMEISFGDFDEEDIVRIDDVYGRITGV